jgi:hypothetical protein
MIGSETSIKLETQVTGNIGLYYACYKLSCMGWNVMPTSRNARGIDIIAYNKNATGFIGVQVKTLSKRNPVPLGNSLDKIMGKYWIIINNAAKEPNAFIMESDKVRGLAQKNEKNGIISYWLDPKAYDKPEFKDAWGLIGHGHDHS